MNKEELLRKGFSKEILEAEAPDISGVRGEFAATRPQDHLKKHPSIRQVAKQNHGQITDLSGNHKVTLDWHMNEAAERDKVFKLTIDDKEVYLNVDELMFYIRVI